MGLKRFAGLVVFVLVLFSPFTAWSAHPLITDDTGTQGKGRFQLELNGQYDRDKEIETGAPVESTAWQAGATLSYGIVESADLVLNLPYVSAEVEKNGISVYDEDGISDVSLEVKWRFYETGGLSFALKPGIILPTGDEKKELGAGRVGYHLFLIGSKEYEPWAFHVNLGYIRNNNVFDEKENIWHASIASMYEAVRGLNLVANVGIESNPDQAADNDPAFAVLGAIYAVNEDFDIDAGIKFGLTSSETDMSLMAGIAVRF